MWYGGQGPTVVWTKSLRLEKSPCRCNCYRLLSIDPDFNPCSRGFSADSVQ
ncbi:hypothetical protein Plhal304r1_c049g0130931 [Plasmopara halstedii]